MHSAFNSLRSIPFLVFSVLCLQDLGVITLRKRLVDDGILVEQDGYLLFVRDAEFSSPSAAASVIHGGGANGLTEWRTELARDETTTTG
jgi:hypothetical protein